jgi:hypothetical protein
MNEIFEQIKNKSRLRILVGVFFVLFGLLIHLIPLVPGSWAIVIGLEILGIRLLVQDKLKKRFKESNFFCKILNVKK